MVTNILKLGLLITAAPIILAASCNKDKTKPCPNGDIYNFSVTSEFTPQREVYNVGDTIFFSSTINKTLHDNLSNQNIDYSNATSIGGGVTASLMDTVSHLINDAITKFEVIPLVGNISTYTYLPEKGVNIFYVESLSYSFKFALKLKQKGLFQLAVTNLSSKGLIGKNCTNAGFDMTVTNNNKNLNLFQYALGYTPDALLQKSIYCFRVQ